MHTSREAQNSMFHSNTKAPPLIITYDDLQWLIDLDRVLIKPLAFQFLVSFPFFRNLARSNHKYLHFYYGFIFSHDFSSSLFQNYFLQSDRIFSVHNCKRPVLPLSVILCLRHGKSSRRSAVMSNTGTAP